MDRFVLTNARWAKMEPFCLGKPTDPGRTGGDNRLFLEAVLWDRAHGQPMEISAADVRQLEYGVQALSRLGEARRFQADFP
jgi:hypothetical protein